MVSRQQKGTKKHIAGSIARFDQRNEMFKRALWDETLGENFRAAREKIWGCHYPKNIKGYSHQDLAFNEAAWYIERCFARGGTIHNTGLYAWEGKPGSMGRIPPNLKLEAIEPGEMSRQVKKAALFFGASQAGICELDRRWIYSHSFNRDTREHKELEIPKECRYAVVLTFAMDYELTKTSPTWLSGSAEAKAYSMMPFTSSMLAQFIRGLGYQALPSGNDTGLSIPMAIDAGLGELGRNGMLITREFGPRVRIAKVLTDLPLVPDEPLELGVTAFCAVCQKCARFCPSQAIINGEMTTEPHNICNSIGELKWPVDAEKCYGFWISNDSTCLNCIRVCPFNKPLGWIHDGARWLVKKQPWLDNMLVKMDDLLGYGKQTDASSYWIE